MYLIRSRPFVLAITFALTVYATAFPVAVQDTADSRAVAVTFDDLPARGSLDTMRDTTQKLLRVLVANRVPAIGFVNEAKLFAGNEVDARTALLSAWLEAGFDLGNHTYSHVGIDQVPFETYRADLIKGEAVTSRLLAVRGRRLRYFRHPQLRTGPTPEYKAALDQLLLDRGYRVAPVTIDNNDFIFAEVYERARRSGDDATMVRVGEAYVPYLASVVSHFEALSLKLLGYHVKQTLLLHANELNADHLEDLLAMFRGRGYRFVSLDEALADPAYSLPDAPASRGLSWLHRWMLARQLAMEPEPLEPDFVRELFTAVRRQ